MKEELGAPTNLGEGVFNFQTGVRAINNFEANKKEYAEKYLNVGLLTNIGVDDINYKIFEVQEKLGEAKKSNKNPEEVQKLQAEYDSLMTKKYSSTNREIDKKKNQLRNAETQEDRESILKEIEELKALKSDVFDTEKQYKTFESSFVGGGAMKEMWLNGLIPKDATALEAMQIYYTVLDRELQAYNDYYASEQERFNKGEAQFVGSQAIREALPILKTNAIDDRSSQLTTELKSLAPVVLLNKNNLDQNSWLLRTIGSWYGSVVENKDAFKRVYNLDASQEDIANNGYSV